jgi:hypothetical protein
VVKDVEAVMNEARIQVAKQAAQGQGLRGLVGVAQGVVKQDQGKEDEASAEVPLLHLNGDQ